MKLQLPQTQKPRKENLVISTVGDQSLHFHWLPTVESNYDLALIYYGDGEGYTDEVALHIKRKGPKYHLLHDIIQERPEILDYKYIWMPDDDIALTSGQIHRMFKINTKYKLWISQPSIMGWYGLNVTLHHKECFMRFTNYVEIMCPCFESGTLKKCLGTFKENKTGWGIDHAWNKILNHPTDKIAIIDDIVAFHTRPVGGGDTYKNQTAGKMSGAQKENFAVYDKYNLGESSYEDLKNGRIVSTESFETRYHNTVEYSRIYKQLEAGIDVSERLWPPTEIIQDICKALRDKRVVSDFLDPCS